MLMLFIIAGIVVFFWMWGKLLGNFSPGRERRIAAAVGVAIIAIFAVAVFFSIEP